jgi:hypothetical protein
MTMPNERTRALRFGYEVLQEICGDGLASENERSRAAELLTTYPSPAAVLSWIEADAREIPIASALAIEGAGDLFRPMLRSTRCPPELRRGISFALRHFPEPGEAASWSRSPGRTGWTIRVWLLPENLYG